MALGGWIIWRSHDGGHHRTLAGGDTVHLGKALTCAKMACLARYQCGDSSQGRVVHVEGATAMYEPGRALSRGRDIWVCER